jgi:CrcB protein
MLWYIAAGSAAGGVTRYLLGLAIQRATGTSFPVGTLAINVTGSLLVGFLLRWTTDGTVSAETRALLTTGFCGGYTTFSTFSYETIRLVEDGEWARAAAYTVLSVTLSVSAAFVGIVLARRLLRLPMGV